MYFICRMATVESGVTALTAAAIDPVVLKRNSDDVGWEYGVLVDSLNKEKVRCLLCGHCSSGGIYRLKHVGHVGSAVAKCKKITPKAKDKCKKSLEEATRKRKEKSASDSLRFKGHIYALATLLLAGLVSVSVCCL
jgi:hypothetical protein